MYPESVYNNNNNNNNNNNYYNNNICSIEDKPVVL